MSFLNLENKKFLVVGVANRKSVAWSVAKVLEEEGAEVLYCVRNAKRKKDLENLLHLPGKSSPVILKKRQRSSSCKNVSRE